MPGAGGAEALDAGVGLAPPSSASWSLDLGAGAVGGGVGIGVEPTLAMLVMFPSSEAQLTSTARMGRRPDAALTKKLIEY